MAFLGPIGPVDVVHQLPGFAASLQNVVERSGHIADRIAKSVDSITQTFRFALVVFSAAACLLVAVVSPGDIGKATLFLLAVGAGYWWVNERESYWKEALEKERKTLEAKWGELAGMRGQFRRAVMEAAMLGGRIEAPSSPIFSLPHRTSKSAEKRLSLQGSATFTTLHPHPSHALRTASLLLADSWPSDRGAAFLHQAVDLAQGFVTEFSFRISDGQGGPGVGGDGFAFVVQRERPEAMGRGGGGMGYEGIRNGIALEFDTWLDPSPTSDPSANHISLHHPCTSSHSASLGCTSRIPQLSSGRPFRCRVCYLHSDRTVRVYLQPPADSPDMSLLGDDGDSQGPPGGAWSRVLSARADLVKLLGGRHAFVGFAASTNAAPQRHEVFLWTVWSGTDAMAEQEGDGDGEGEMVDVVDAVESGKGGQGKLSKGHVDDVLRMDSRGRTTRRGGGDDDDMSASVYVDAPETPGTPGGGGTGTGNGGRRGDVRSGNGGLRTPGERGVGGGVGVGAAGGTSPGLSRRPRGRDRERELETPQAGLAGAITREHGHGIGQGQGQGQSGSSPVLAATGSEESQMMRRGPRGGGAGGSPQDANAELAHTSGSPHDANDSARQAHSRSTPSPRVAPVGWEGEGGRRGEVAGGDGEQSRSTPPRERQRPELTVLGIGSIGGVS
ncbi:concanavalin A-like lectin/glucanase [Gonapodya prolifera JEL478]|uniref:Concanavalin A-like lectin/glucanase n=1 Tax=Gonapodya prolifera (strain JEL478) TaxID=1344416 RepID=A0A139A7X1_GONPJ|nr:concanavalin A-like lectin/glucanase [Gonapodya prolifera JEL478]|eukprot:KXS12896.1 concanavalin A-like lectin/glucanase [Gonapodya prolifera JEL478]